MTKISLLDIFASSGTFRLKLIKSVDFVAGTVLALVLPRKADRDARSIVPHDLLIIRPGGIGDAVFLLPITRALRAQFPDLNIDILCERRNAGAFLAQKDLFRTIYRYDVRDDMIRIRRQRYDVIADTEQWHYLSAIFASTALKADCLIGYATRRLRAKLFNYPVAYDPAVYELENFLNLFPFLTKDVPRDIAGSFKIGADMSRWAGGAIPKRSVTFAIGASIAERRLNFDLIETILRYIADQGFTPVLLGGRDVINLAAKFQSFHPELISYVGRTSLLESAALIGRSSLFIGPDSGLMHVAAAVGTPTIGIFGPGNAKKWGLKGDKHRMLSKELPCSPCTRFGYTIPTCRGRYPCMNELDVRPIEEWIKEIHA